MEGFHMCFRMKVGSANPKPTQDKPCIACLSDFIWSKTHTYRKANE